MALNIIKSQSEQECAEVLSDALITSLNEGNQTLWLVPGGSNIKIAVLALDLLLKKVAEEILKNLRMTLTDERYGPVGHKDSNWQQMIDAGFQFEKIQATPLLTGLPLTQTVENYGKNISHLIEWADKVVAQFGIGADGHIGGVLPHTIGVHSNDVAIGYESAPFVRMSMSLKTMQEIDVAYAFVFGESKHAALSLLAQEGSLEEIPSRILHQIPQSYLYTDQEIG